jgi:hypothetical protein
VGTCEEGGNHVLRRDPCEQEPEQYAQEWVPREKEREPYDQEREPYDQEREPCEHEQNLLDINRKRI